jgi:hypothetical protein
VSRNEALNDRSSAGKSPLVSLVILTLAAIGFSFYGLHLQNNLTAQVNHQATLLADGGIKVESLSPSLKSQLEAAVAVAGALPVKNESGQLASCADGQVLSFQNGKVICVALIDGAGKQVNVTVVGSPSSSSRASKERGNMIDVDVNPDSGSQSPGVSNGSTRSTLSAAGGTVGLAGPTGPKGDVGATGADGQQGEKGDPGVLGVALGDGLTGSIASQVLSIDIVTDPTGGLVTGSNGLSLLASCSSGQIMKFDGNAWDCGSDNNGAASSANLTSATSGVTITGGTGAVLGSGASISIATASGAQSGLLSAANWTTFNNKENALTFNGNGLFSRSGNDINGIICSANQILVFNGSTWICGSDKDNNTTYAAGSGLSLNGTVLSFDPSSLTGISSVANDDEFVLTTASGSRKISYQNLFSGVLGSLNYRGTWDASTNVPALSSPCAKGYYYVVSIAGTTSLDDNSSWNVGDWVVCNGTTFDRLETTNSVTSVHGRTGAVMAQNGDYNAGQITNTPSGSITAVTVQSAINQLESGKISTALAAGKLLVGDGSNLAAAVTLSGDATLSTAGALTIKNDAITSNKIANGTIQFADIGSNGCSADQLVKYTGSAWTCATPAPNMSIGALDGTAGSVSGAVLSGGVLYLQSASATLPGLINTGTQTFAGAKTFSGNGITTGEVQKIVADALTSGNGLYVSSGSTALTGNLAKFGLTGSNNANTGTVVSIDAGSNANVLPLKIVSGNNQMASYINGSAANSGYYTGSGSPDGTVTANIGSYYSDTLSGAMFIKSANNGQNTGWTILSSGVAASYMQATLSVPQTTNIGQNDHVKFDKVNVSTGTDIILNTSASYSTAAGISSLGRFTLKAGKTYLLNGVVTMSGNGSNGALDTGWYNVTSGQYMGNGNSIYTPNAGANDAGGGVNQVVYTPGTDTIVELRVIGQSAVTQLGIDNNRLPSAFIQVIGGNAPVIGQSADYSYRYTGTGNQSVSASNTVIQFPNDGGSNGVDFNTSTNTWTLKAGKTYELEASLAMVATGPDYTGTAWQNVTTNTRIGSGSFNPAATSGTNYTTNSVAKAIFSPAVDTQVRLQTQTSFTGGTVNSTFGQNGYAKIQQIGSTALTGIAMNKLADALASGALDNKGYTQNWSWNSLGGNDGLVINSDDTSASGNLASITSATQTGNAMRVTANSLTSGNGLIIASSATGMTGNLVSISLTGNNAGNNGTLLSLSANGAANAVAGLKINVLGSGLALDISGGVAFRPGGNYTSTGTQNNVSFGSSSTYRLAPASALTITGIANGTDGKLLTLMNTSASSVTLSNQSASSATSNRIVSGNDADLVLAKDQSALMQYDATASRWRVISTTAITAKTGESTLASNFTTTSTSYVNTGMSITLPSAGTYVVTYDVDNYNTTANFENFFRLYNGSSEVAGSVSRVQGDVPSYGAGTATKTIIITVNGPATYQLQAKTNIGTLNIESAMQPRLLYYSLK